MPHYISEDVSKEDPWRRARSAFDLHSKADTSWIHVEECPIKSRSIWRTVIRILIAYLPVRVKKDQCVWKIPKILILLVFWLSFRPIGFRPKEQWSFLRRNRSAKVVDQSNKWITFKLSNYKSTAKIDNFEKKKNAIARLLIDP